MNKIMKGRSLELSPSHAITTQRGGLEADGPARLWNGPVGGGGQLTNGGKQQGTAAVTHPVATAQQAVGGPGVRLGAHGRSFPDEISTLAARTCSGHHAPAPA